MRVFAQAHEHAGFDRILVPASSSSPDTLLTVNYAASVTDRIGFCWPTAPALWRPRWLRASSPRSTTTPVAVAVHYITGGSDEDQQRDGDFVDHDERYARTDEYLGLLRQVWTADKPFDHEGAYYRVWEGAWSEVKPVQAPYVPIYFGGIGPRLAGSWQARRCVCPVGRIAGAGGRPGAPRARRGRAPWPHCAVQHLVPPHSGRNGRRSLGPRLPHP